MTSSIKGVLHQRLSSINGHLPSKVVFYLRSSSIKVRLPSMVFFQQRSSFIKLYPYVKFQNCTLIPSGKFWWGVLVPVVVLVLTGVKQSQLLICLRLRLGFWQFISYVVNFLVLLPNLIGGKVVFWFTLYLSEQFCKNQSTPHCLTNDYVTPG